MRERRLERQVRERLAAEPGCWSVKLHGGPWGRVGAPDRIGCCAGVFFAAELKSGGGAPTERQLRELAAVRAAGGEAAVVRSLADLEALLARCRARSAGKVFDVQAPAG